jgi:hypothetical protein
MQRNVVSTLFWDYYSFPGQIFFSQKESSYCSEILNGVSNHKYLRTPLLPLGGDFLVSFFKRKVPRRGFKSQKVRFEATKNIPVFQFPPVQLDVVPMGAEKS